LNDHGDVALMSATVAQLYDAGAGTFLDVAAVPGWPPNISASSRSDLSNSGDVTFWREGLYVFDSTTSRFTKLDGIPGGPPAGGTETDLNSTGQIVLTAGDDVWLATPRPYGDHDNDGDVDGGDFLAWQRGESPDPLSSIDLADWRANFGAPFSASANSTAAPEPSIATLLIIAAVGSHCRRRRTTLRGSHRTSRSNLSGVEQKTRQSACYFDGVACDRRLKAI
jgi:hypothetical protein